MGQMVQPLLVEFGVGDVHPNGHDVRGAIRLVTHRDHDHTPAYVLPVSTPALGIKRALLSRRRGPHRRIDGRLRLFRPQVPEPRADCLGLRPPHRRKPARVDGPDACLLVQKRDPVR